MREAGNLGIENMAFLVRNDIACEEILSFVKNGSLAK